jgi:hypothetical protein
MIKYKKYSGNIVNKCQKCQQVVIVLTSGK